MLRAARVRLCVSVSRCEAGCLQGRVRRGRPDCAGGVHIMHVSGAYHTLRICVLCMPQYPKNAGYACPGCNHTCERGRPRVLRRMRCTLCIFCLLCIRESVLRGTVRHTEKSSVPAGLLYGDHTAPDSPRAGNPQKPVRQVCRIKEQDYHKACRVRHHQKRHFGG